MRRKSCEKVRPTHLIQDKEGKTSCHSWGARVDWQQAVGGAWGPQILIIQRGSGGDNTERHYQEVRWLHQDADWGEGIGEETQMEYWIAKVSLTTLKETDQLNLSYSVDQTDQDWKAPKAFFVYLPHK